MNKPRIVLPFVVAGLVLATAFATATLVNAAEDNPDPVALCLGSYPEPDDLFAIGPLSDAMRARLVLADDSLLQAEEAALFAIAPLSESGRARLVLTDARLLHAEVAALFEIAPVSAAKRATWLKADEDAALQQAEVDAMFAVAPMAVSKPGGPAKELDPRSARGRDVYLGLCFACHLPDGKGVAGVFPPLAGSDYLMADRERAAQVVLSGLVGPVTVNGAVYNSAMPPLATALTEEQISDVLTYVTGEWGNQGKPYSVEDIRRVHRGIIQRTAAPASK